jgi:serine/threonine-protein kinase
VPFELAKVVLPVEDGTVDLVVFAPQHRYVDKGDLEPAGGETTATAFSLDESAKYFHVLVALCEPRLRDSASVAVPTDNEIVERLRPLPACAGLTRSAVNFHLDYLARMKLRLREPASPDGERIEARRAALVALALRFDLVLDDHLALLPARP